MLDPSTWKATGVYIESAGRVVAMVDSDQTAPRERRKSAPSLADAYAHAEFIAAGGALADSARRLQWLCTELEAGNAFSSDVLANWRREAQAALARAGVL